MGREKEMSLLARLCWFVLTFEATLGQRFQSLTGTAGQAVSLPCGSDNGCTWRKDGEELALDERSDQARFTIGSCALTIEPVLPGDEGLYECNNEKSRHRLTVLVASEKTEAVYRCHVFSDGNKLVSSLPASLTLIRKPVVKMESEKWASLGQDVIPNCASRAVSNRTRLVWLKSNGKVGDLDPVQESSRLEVITQYKDWQRTSRLLIKNIEKKDFGEYACFAENQVGTDLAMIQLRVKTSVDILSVVAALTYILGVVLLIAIFVYIRLKKRCCGNLPEEKC